MRSPEKTCERHQRRSRHLRRIIASAFFLLLLIQLPVGSQTPTPRINPRAFIAPTVPPPYRGHVISPAVPTASQTIQQSATKPPRLLYSASATATAAPTGTLSIKPTLSKKRSVTTGSGTHSIPWKYVIPIGLLVAIAGYLLRKLNRDRKRKRMALRPTFHLYWDHATPQKPPQNMAINYELHFDPNLSKGSHQLEINGTNLIISRRKEI
jgi:hypothetical protein